MSATIRKVGRPLTAPCVLVVDDSRALRLYVSNLLRNAGFDVIEAGDGQAGIDVAKGKDIALVISDKHMPIMDGLTMVRTLRAMPEFRFTPMLMLSTDRENKEQASAAGIAAWMTKPVSPEVLVETATRFIRLATEALESV